MNKGTKTKSNQHALDTFRSALYREVHRDPQQEAALAKRLIRATARVDMPSRTHRAAVVSAVAAAAALVALGLFVVLSPQRPIEPRSLSGLVRLDALPTAGDRLYAVPPDTGAKLLWEDGTVLWLKGQSVIGFEGAAPSSVRMRSGAILASVAKKEAAGFSIETPYGTVRVHGTVFSVWIRDDGVTVRLHEGRVAFDGPAGAVSLVAGDALDVTGDGANTVSFIDDEGLLQDLMIAERTAELDGPVVPLFGRNIEMSPVAVKGERPAATKPVVKPAPRKNGRRGRGRVVTVATEPVDAGLPAPPPFTDPELFAIEVKSAKRPPAHLHLESLIRERAYGECIDAANDALGESMGNKERERVLYLKGYCEMRSGNLKAGREAFENYLIQFPKGKHQQRIHDILGE